MDYIAIAAIAFLIGAYARWVDDAFPPLFNVERALYKSRIHNLKKQIARLSPPRHKNGQYRKAKA